MANENVKIVIKEVNETKPLGEGVSSDIAYVPGFAVQSYVKGDTLVETRKNTPLLCNTIEQFEQYFGPDPYRLTEYDVNSCYAFGENTNTPVYLAGDYDRSYIYAKELINNGMSVIYENLSPTEDVAKYTNVGNVTYYPRETIVDGNRVVVEDLKKAYPNCYVFSTDTETEQFVARFKFGAYTSGSKTVVALVEGPSAWTVSSVSLDETPSTEASTNNYLVFDAGANGEIDNTEFYIHIAKTQSKFRSVNVNTPRIYVFVLEGALTVDHIETEDVLPQMSRLEYFYKKLSGDAELDLESSLEVLEDKNEYSVKYLTTGGYASVLSLPYKMTVDGDGTVEYDLIEKPYDETDMVTDVVKKLQSGLAIKMLDLAQKRGDCVAIIDHYFDNKSPIAHTEESSVYYRVHEELQSANYSEYGTMFTPWSTYTCSTVPDIDAMEQIMPASFGYLMCLSTAIKTAPNWYAMAGVTRGLVPNIKELHVPKGILSNVVAEHYQPKFGSDGNKISINAITDIKPYGLTIWGNRTLLPVDPKGTIALNFLNTRNMISDIKKVAYDTCKKLMFEQDSDILWLNFKSSMSPLLDRLQSGNGISGYKLIRGTKKYDGTNLTRGEMAAVIKIFPKYAIEYFEITVVVADEDVVVS